MSMRFFVDSSRSPLCTVATRWVIGIALTSLSSAFAHAQGQPPARLRTDSATLPARIAAPVRASIERLADSLDRERLPGAAVLDKAAEGALKGADDTRILAAVNMLAQRLRSARTLLGANATAEELMAASSALYAGVSTNAVSTLVNTHRRRSANAQPAVSLTVSLLVVAELSTARVPTEVALSTVTELISRGAVDGDLRAFRTAVDRDIRQGMTPRDAATTGASRIVRGLDRVP